MTPPMWLALGGAAGAFIRCLGENKIKASLWPPAIGGEAVATIFIAAVSMGLVGVVPSETLAQWIPGLGSITGAANDPFIGFLLGALGAYSGIDLSWVLRRRLGNGTGPKAADQKGRASLPVVLVAGVLALALAGCASLGLESSTVSFPRDELLLLYGDAKADYKLAEYLIGAGCAGKTIPEPVCAAGVRVQARAVEFDQRLRDAVAAKQALTLQDLRGFLAAAAELARLAGYPVPSLGGLGLAPK